MISKFASTLKLLCFCIVLTMPLFPQDARLTELRKAFALRYLQPDAHFALAKYYLDRGDHVQAFFIIEYARRYRFEEKDFDEAYMKFFGDPMPEPPKEAKDLFETANKLWSQQKYDEAETFLQKANSRYDKSFFMNVWIGRFYYKVRKDTSRALPYYFKAYFLYPHAYETEYAEYRIRAITAADAEVSFNTSLARGKSLSNLSRDQNPLIVNAAIREMGKNWKPEYLNVILDAMGNDDSLVRWNAFITLHKFAGTERGRIVDELLSSDDLRKRGLAAYAIVEQNGQDKFSILKKLLADPAELVRFDAVSALALNGGVTGKQILTEHQRIERQPRLKALIDKALKESTK